MTYHLPMLFQTKENVRKIWFNNYQQISQHVVNSSVPAVVAKPLLYCIIICINRSLAVPLWRRHGLVVWPPRLGLPELGTDSPTVVPCAIPACSILCGALHPRGLEDTPVDGKNPIRWRVPKSKCETALNYYRDFSSWRSFESCSCGILVTLHRNNSTPASEKIDTILVEGYLILKLRFPTVLCSLH